MATGTQNSPHFTIIYALMYFCLHLVCGNTVEECVTIPLSSNPCLVTWCC